MAESAIEITDLRKSFDDGKTFVLKGVDLTIPKGKLTVIIGYSGTGKSVLLKHILGLLHPTSGSLKVLGKELWDMKESELMEMRKRLGAPALECSGAHELERLTSPALH